MADIATGAAANVAAETAKGIFQEVRRHVRYVLNYKKMVEKFEEKMESLKAKRNGLQQEIDAEEKKAKTRKPDVELWCKRVDNTIDEKSKKVKELENQAKAKCFLGLCPNIKYQYQLSRKVGEAIVAIDELLQARFEKVAVRTTPKALISASSKNFMAFDSRKEVFNEIMEALKDPTIRMIGVHGPGGVGKTTLVKQVARQAEMEKSFDLVVIVTVTVNPNIEEIQQQIIEQLGLKLEEKTIQVRASRMIESLKKEKNILIVLDDLWVQLPLNEVGIRFEDQQKGCKILMTSRNENVLTKMDVKEPIAIRVLEEKAAWDLFKKMAENNFEDQELAIEVAKRCGGLPLAIATVARALRNKALHYWKDASRQLLGPSPRNFKGIPEAIYSSVELSYKHLQSEELRKTFLLSCLLGRNFHIEDLLRWTMGLHLFSDVNRAEETRNSVLTMVSDLKASCLLIDGYDNDHFSMHDFVHDVALAIAYRDNHAFALKDWQDDQERMERFEMISLSFANIKKLVNELDCPKLNLVATGSNGEDSNVEMPTNFFEKMRNIKVLDLIKMDLLSSISLPTSLQTLCLKECVLRDMVNLGKLKNLKILSLSGSKIEMLPKEIKQLEKLRLLDLSHCDELRKIPIGVLSSLSSLEELYMSYVDFPWNEPSNAHLDELKGLSTLHIKILDASMVPKDLFSEKLQKYQILIGEEWYWRNHKVEYPTALKLRVNKSIDHLDDGFKLLLKKTEALYLENLEGVKIVLNQMWNRNCILHLKLFHIEKASKVEYIMNDDGIEKIAFTRLQSLKLVSLPELVSFCSRNKSKGSTSAPKHELSLFGEQMKLPCLKNLHLSSINVERIWHDNIHQELTSLVIENCGNLKYIFSSSMATSLVNLKSFTIVSCRSLGEIIFSEEIEEEKNVTISFPQLSTLKMENLEHLIGFCSENYNLRFPSLKRVDVWKCPNLKGFIYKSTTEENKSLTMQALFNEKVECPNLLRLHLWLTKVERIWDDHLSQMYCSVQNLEHVIVHSCENLRYLFSSSMLPLFKQLKVIDIQGCKNMEEVICKEGTAKADTVVNQIFPKLRSLELLWLFKLITFCHCHGSHLELPSLIDLKINECRTFKTFISDSTMANENDKGRSFDIDWPPLFNEKIAFPQLEKLEIYNMEKHRRIWHSRLTGDSFSKLKLLAVSSCDGLVNVFPFSMSERLQNLDNLGVRRCSSLEEIFETQTLNVEELQAVTATNSIDVEETTTHFAFPKLKSLQFDKLPRLKRFNSRIYITEWPLLNNMLLSELDMVEILFASERISFGENQRPLFWVNEVTFPNLEELRLFYVNMGKIWHEQLEAGFFSKLKVLELIGPKKKEVLELQSLTETPAVFPHCFIQSLPDLQKLCVIDSDFSQIFDLDGFGDNEIHPLTLTFSTLRSLVVGRCGNLKTFVPPSVSFQNLTELDVWGCDGLVNLIAFSTAKSLVQLTKMSIRDCKMIEEIMAVGQGDEVKEAIVFTELKHLELSSLPSLSSFCSRDHDFEFPALETMIVERCPKMENFCQGEPSTPQLQKVNLTKYGEEKWRWEGNVNTTIRQMFEEMVINNLKECPKLRR